MASRQLGSRARRAVAVALCTWLAATVAAADEARPRVGLVLSGGGARGAAHIGVLKVLEEQHVPVDAIAGSSMGAVVGSLYASGLSAAEIERIIGSVDWQDAFRDRPPREDLNFRRKQDDLQFLVRTPLGLRGRTLQFPRGLVEGQKLNQKLRAALLQAEDVADFDHLPIPFRCLATDLATGAPVVFASGSLATAVRASMAVPGLFAPVDVAGKLLVDAGLSENLPVELLRTMGVDVIIAVDVSSPLQPRAELDSALAVSNQMVAILINRVTERSRALLGAGDVLITPQLDVSSVEFGRVRDAIAAGELAARQAAPALARLAVPEQQFQRFLARGAAPPPPPIAFVRAAPDSGDYHKFIEAALEPVVGQPATGSSVDPAMRGLYGRDLFGSLDYRLVHDGDQAGLEVSAQRKSWGPTYMRLLLNLQDDFQGNSAFTAGVRFLVTEVNPYMAEWNIDLQVGEQPKFAAEFYQPLGYASPWFVAPDVSIGSRSVQVQQLGQLLGEYRVRETEYGLDFGRELSDWGEVRVGVQKVTGSTHLQIGSPGTLLPAARGFNQGGEFVRLSFDRLDSVNFPTHGELMVLEVDRQRSALGADRDAATATLNWLLARSHERNTLILWTSAGSALSAAPGVQNYFPLGGFLSLSGVSAGAIAGPHFGIGRLIYLRKLTGGEPTLFGMPAYLGASLEAGNVWQRRSDASFATTLKDGSLFLGLDTPFGPAYLGTGYGQGGHTAYYLFLGRTF